MQSAQCESDQQSKINAMVQMHSLKSVYLELGCLFRKFAIYSPLLDANLNQSKEFKKTLRN